MAPRLSGPVGNLGVLVGLAAWSLNSSIWRQNVTHATEAENLNMAQD